MKDSRRGSRTCAVLGIPDQLDAGAALALRVKVTVDPPADLSKHEVEIVDADAQVVGAAELSASDGNSAVFTTDEILLAAPEIAGEHVWMARLAAYETDEVYYPATGAVLSLRVLAHRIAPVVWDVPSTMAPAGRFRVKVGGECTAGCNSSGWAVSVRDHTGRIVAEAKTGDALWQGTKGLRYAELDIVAPDEVGLFAWCAVVDASNARFPHEAGRKNFNVRTTPPADAHLRIEAVDAESGDPLSDLQVVVHPFRNRTGPDGSAEIALPSGEYRVFVSGRGYIPYRVECAIDKFKTLCVNMEPHRGLSDADRWS